MRKKSFAVLLAVSLVLTATACGNNTENSENVSGANEGNIVENDVAPTVTEAPAMTDAPTITEEPADQAGNIMYVIGSQVEIYQSIGGEVWSFAYGGDQVSVVKEHADGWYEINYGGTPAYISTGVVCEGPDCTIDENMADNMIVVGDVELLAAPEYGSLVLDYVMSGDSAYVIGKTDNGFYKVMAGYNGTGGYLPESALVTYEEYESATSEGEQTYGYQDKVYLVGHPERYIVLNYDGSKIQEMNDLWENGMGDVMLYGQADFSIDEYSAPISLLYVWGDETQETLGVYYANYGMQFVEEVWQNDCRIEIYSDESGDIWSFGFGLDQTEWGYICTIPFRMTDYAGFGLESVKDVLALFGGIEVVEGTLEYDEHGFIIEGETQPMPEPTAEPTVEPTKAPEAEPTKAPNENIGNLTGKNLRPTVDEFLASRFKVPIVESNIKGLYMGTYGLANHSNRYMVIAEDKIDVYLYDGTHFTYTADQISTAVAAPKGEHYSQYFVIHDGSGATIRIEDYSRVKYDGTMIPSYNYIYELEDKRYVIQAELSEIFNGKHLYDVNYDDMGEWGCIPVTDIIKEKLLSGLVTDDFRIQYTYSKSNRVQEYCINDYDIDGSSSQYLYLNVYESEELAQKAYEQKKDEVGSRGFAELDGNMVLYAKSKNPLSTVNDYPYSYYKAADLASSAYGEHCYFDYDEEYATRAVYCSKPISLELGEEINKANALIGPRIGNEYYADPTGAEVILSFIYAGNEFGVHARCWTEDGTEIVLNRCYLTDVKVDGNKMILVSNNCQESTATLAELVIKDGVVEVTMKSYAGVDDLTIENSSRKTVTAELSAVAKSAY